MLDEIINYVQSLQQQVEVCCFAALRFGPFSFVCYDKFLKSLELFETNYSIAEQISRCKHQRSFPEISISK